MAILAEKYATDYTWYVDVILKLIRIAGDYVSEEVWYRVIQVSKLFFCHHQNSVKNGSPKNIWQRDN